MARKYDHEYKVQAVKLAKEIGGAKAAKELGIPEGTIHTWLKAVRSGKLDIGEGSHTPASAMSLSEEITMLRKRVKEQDKEIRRLKEENVSTNLDNHQGSKPPTVMVTLYPYFSI